MRLLVGAIGAVGLILLSAFVAARLLRARTAGFSIRMQVFLALAAIVFAFALGLGLLVLDRIQARATTLAEESARDEAAAIAALIGGELEAQGSLAEVGRKLALARSRGTAALHVTLFDPAGHAIFNSGPSPDEPGPSGHRAHRGPRTSAAACASSRPRWSSSGCSRLAPPS